MKADLREALLKLRSQIREMHENHEKVMRLAYWGLKSAIEMRIATPSLKGKRGRIGKKKERSFSLSNIDLLKRIHLEKEKFEDLVACVRNHKVWNEKYKIQMKETTLSLEERILIFMDFFTNHTKGTRLADEYKISPSTVSRVIHSTASLMSEVMKDYIPEKFDDDVVNPTFTPLIGGIIDGTIHPIATPSDFNINRKYYRSDKKCCFTQTHLIIDWNKKIIAVSTGWPGSFSDNSIASDKLFQKVCENRMVIADTGYQGVPWVCAGFRKSQLRSKEAKIWDRVSRAQQKPIEHTNAFIKKNDSISKRVKFAHSLKLQKHLIIFACGLYNWALERKYKYVSTTELYSYLNREFSEIEDLEPETLMEFEDSDEETDVFIESDQESFSSTQ